MVSVLQGSVLGPLSVKIYSHDLFLFITESNIANYVVDTNLYECELNLLEARTKIETKFMKAFGWLRSK